MNVMAYFKPSYGVNGLGIPMGPMDAASLHHSMGYSGEDDIFLFSLLNKVITDKEPFCLELMENRKIFFGSEIRILLVEDKNLVLVKLAMGSHLFRKMSIAKFIKRDLPFMK